MRTSANFAFLKHGFPHAVKSAGFAERYVYGDPRVSCFHVTRELEGLATLEKDITKAREELEGMLG